MQASRGSARHVFPGDRAIQRTGLIPGRKNEPSAKHDQSREKKRWRTKQAESDIRKPGASRADLIPDRLAITGVTEPGISCVIGHQCHEHNDRERGEHP